MPRFKLLAGRHIQVDTETGKERTYNPGEIFESPVDLLSFNRRGMNPKFERIFEGSSTGSLSDMTVAEAARRGFITINEMQPKPAAGPIPDKHTVVTLSPEVPAKASVKKTDTAISDPTYNAALDKMSLKELQAHAAEEEIDLKGSVKREDILRILKQAR